MTPIKSISIRLSLLSSIGLLCGNPSLIHAQAAQAQTASESNAASDIVSMSAFEVNTTADEGYVSHESTTGLKSNTSVMDIPESIYIVTSDMLRDVGEFHEGFADSARYAVPGMTSFASLDSVILRGFNNGAILEDGFPNLGTYVDEASVDSIDVLMGPTAVLYSNSAVTGTIIKNSKRPLHTPQQEVIISGGSGDFYRAQVDVTGPLINFEGGHLDYRLVGAYQNFAGFTKPIDIDNRRVLYPSFKLVLNDTTILFQAELEQTQHSNYTAVPMHLNANGYTDAPWQGAGKYQSWRDPNESHPFHDYRYRGSIVQRFNANWEMHLYAEWERVERKDQESRWIANPNQTTLVGNMNWFGNFQWTQNDYVADDINGKYSIFGTDMVSTFGLNYVENLQYTWQASAPIVGGTNVSLVQPNALFGVAQPPLSAFTPSRDTTLGTNQFFAAYYMQTIYLLDKHIVGVVGTSYEFVRNITEDYTLNKAESYGPDGEASPYKLGLVIKPIKGISVYADKATTFSPSTSRVYPGTLLGNQIGQAVEYGVKADLFDGRLGGTIDYFELSRTNVGVPDTAPGHIAFVLPIGLLKNKGVESAVYFEPVRGWQTYLTYYAGNVVDQTGNTAAGALNHTASLMTKYRIENGVLKGLSIGGDVFHKSRTWDSAGNGYGFPGYTVENLFLTYTINRRSSITLHINNLANLYYSIGGFSELAWVDYGTPRSFIASYQFKL